MNHQVRHGFPLRHCLILPLGMSRMDPALLAAALNNAHDFMSIDNIVWCHYNMKQAPRWPPRRGYMHVEA